MSVVYGINCAYKIKSGVCALTVPKNVITFLAVPVYFLCRVCIEGTAHAAVCRVGLEDSRTVYLTEESNLGFKDLETGFSVGKLYCNTVWKLSICLSISIYLSIYIYL